MASDLSHGASLGLLLILMQFIAMNALQFDMQVQHKCIYEEINANVIVVGEYNVFHREHADMPQLADLRVNDPHGTLLHEGLAKADGQFFFTTKIAGEYEACFTVRQYQDALTARISIDWRTGVSATDWNAIAKKEHLDELTVELRKLEDSIREVYSEMLLLQQREQEMREISETTNTRVAWYSIASLFVCILSGAWQLWYLRRFFARKKLL